MRERPKEWELFCKVCHYGFLMADEIVSKTVYYENKWPKHCGKIMALRPPLVPKQITYCSDTGCRGAEKRVCMCWCEGKFHGADNYQRNYTSVKYIPQWYNIPVNSTP